VCWILAAALMTAFSAMIIAYHGSIGDFFTMISTGLGDYFRQTGFHGVMFFLYLLILLILGIAGGILLFYLSMSIGQLANEHKFMASVGVFIGIQFALQTIGVLVILSLSRWLMGINLEPWLKDFFRWLGSDGYLPQHLIILAVIAFAFICCAVMLLIIRHLLTRKLNLT
jgi:hypothetical protein